MLATRRALLAALTPRRSPERRVVGVLLACCLVTFQFESLIADVCDGDASPSEVAAFVGAASDLLPDAVLVAAENAAGLRAGGRPFTLHDTRATDARATARSVADAADAGLVAHADTPTATAAPYGGDAPAAPLDGHGAHTCHCVHAHGGALARIAGVPPSAPPPADDISAGRSLTPPSVTLEPRLRPPLA